jgi:TPP-dependent pyruvate/acetoin dehydrogenase alpha subunit
MNGKDLHIGDLEWGILPATAPLSISTLSIAVWRWRSRSSARSASASRSSAKAGRRSGEWHEAINLCAARRLPAVFCLENNQTALSTPVNEQSAVRVFADKAAGYGIPGITIDGTDADAIAGRVYMGCGQGARRATARTLIELVCLRMCGHAHHDDMLYLGKEPPNDWTYPPLAAEHAYANPEQYAFWMKRDPIRALRKAGSRKTSDRSAEVGRFKEEAEALVETEARASLMHRGQIPRLQAPMCSPINHRGFALSHWNLRNDYGSI